MKGHQPAQLGGVYAVHNYVDTRLPAIDEIQLQPILAKQATTYQCTLEA